ncbi:unnamed protein product, partial [Rotaria sp. Silwood2]
ELHLSVVNFLDCLYLLDGHFNKLYTFYVHISSIEFQDIKIDNKDKIPNLRCFSLHCNSIINNFEQLIIYRILNLEKLELNVNISMTTTIIDGNYLKRNILNHMIQLDKFTFNIHSWFGLRNQIYFPSNENIQHTFNNFKNNKIISYNQDLLIIKYPYLTDLTLDLVNDDYVEQFLLNTRTCLPNTVELLIGYEQLKRVTHNFTRNITRINCTKLSSLCMLADEIPKYVKDYFPHTKIY